jgi:hypothetical protein
MRSRIPGLGSLLAISVLLAGCGGADADLGGAEEEEAPGPSEAAELRVTGFSSPESVLHDVLADVYLVSNIVGGPLDKDSDGFISVVSPAGEIVELRWIDGSAEGVELHAPKGMAIVGDSLYVADIDCVRIFHRTTGMPAGSVCPEGATFLNDVAADPEGRLYVTDSGMQAGAAGFEPTGTDAVWRFTPSGELVAIATGGQLGNPNGMTFGPLGATVVTFGTGEVYQLAADGTRREVLAPVEGRQLDGVEFIPEGGFLVSSWDESAVFWVSPEGELDIVVAGVEAPADIGYDARRGRVLIPLLTTHEVLIRLIRLEG